jgi:hypothetical protein
VSRAALEARWLDLTRCALPAVAAARGWPIRADHCFQRVLLDAACGGVWYDRIAGRPAYAHAPAPLLAEAVRLGEAVLAGEAPIVQLNAQSLVWRLARRSSQGQELARGEASHRLF